MPTPKKAINLLLKHYGLDPSDERSMGKFFESLQDNFTEKEIELIGDFLLAAESSIFEFEKELEALPIPSPQKHAFQPRGEVASGALNKERLVAKVSRDVGLTMHEAEKVVAAVVSCISHALQKGDNVRIAGFGTFSVVNRKSTSGRNPRTGETIAIPSSKQPKFKAGKNLKDAVN